MTLELLAVSLAAYRLTRLIVTDTITQRFREWWWMRFPHSGLAVEVQQGDEWQPLQPHMLGNLIACPWCLGFWISLALIASYWAWPQPTFWLALPFAVSVVVGKLGEQD